MSSDLQRAAEERLDNEERIAGFYRNYGSNLKSQKKSKINYYRLTLTGLITVYVVLVLWAFSMMPVSELLEAARK